MKIQNLAWLFSSLMIVAALFPHVTNAASKTNSSSCCAEEQSCCESGEACCN